MPHIFHLVRFLILPLFSWLFHCDIYISTPKEFPAVFPNIVTTVRDRVCLAQESYTRDNVTEEENKNKKSH